MGLSSLFVFPLLFKLSKGVFFGTFFKSSKKKIIALIPTDFSHNLPRHILDYSAEPKI